MDANKLLVIRLWSYVVLNAVLYQQHEERDSAGRRERHSWWRFDSAAKGMTHPLHLNHHTRYLTVSLDISFRSPPTSVHRHNIGAG